MPFSKTQKAALGASLAIAAGLTYKYLCNSTQSESKTQSEPITTAKQKDVKTSKKPAPTTEETKMDSENRTKHPTWHKPSVPEGQDEKNQLRVNNSLTGGSDPFITIDPNQKLVKWYICGPTVYDSAHLGHARAYITFDIIRRILQDYFGYDVFYVMNITDIDDKIILRARENHLFNEYQAEALKNKTSFDDIVKQGEEFFAAALAKAKESVADLEAKLPTVPAKDRKDMEERIKVGHMKAAKVAEEHKISQEYVNTVKNDAKVDPSEKVKQYLALARDVIAKAVDKQKGHEISDQEIFRKHAAYYENEYLEDMRALNVMDPSVLTRVTEYVPDVVAYVQKIIDNGYGYESNGSVYFDTLKFNKDHDYAKLKPEAFGNTELMQEGEGALGSTDSERRTPFDFALWKQSKAGEPSWESPWGKGRPGWHIECSVMASDHLGDQMDIHSGGIDLAFPHHDNELAQAEAHFQCQQWVNYFMHAGHLHIKGSKMSKSLKNFITIRHQLELYTARQIRILFLLQPWDKVMHFDDNGLDEAKTKEKTFKEFFLNTRAAIRKQGKIGSKSQVWDASDRTFFESLQKAQVDSHAALLDNFNYPLVMTTMLDIINDTNKYVLTAAEPKTLILQSVLKFVHRYLSVFGVITKDDTSFSESGAVGNKEDVVGPYLDSFASFREQVRKIAQASKNKDLLQLCDAVRDEDLPKLGVRLEDIAGEGTVWKLEDPAVLQREAEQKQAQKKEAALKKAIAKLPKREAELKRLEDGKSTPQQRFEADGYSQFNADGVPTHDKDGKELQKKALKKVTKIHAGYKKAHDAYLQGVQKNANLLADLKSEIAELKALASS